MTKLEEIKLAKLEERVSFMQDDIKEIKELIEAQNRKMDKFMASAERSFAKRMEIKAAYAVMTAAIVIIGVLINIKEKL